MSIEERIKKVLVNEIGIDRTEVTPSASLADDLGIDSTEMVEIAIVLKKEFGLEISTSALAKPEVITVQDLINLIADGVNPLKRIGK